MLIFLLSSVGGVLLAFVTLVAAAPLRKNDWDRTIAVLVAFFVTPIAWATISLWWLRPVGSPENGLALFLGLYASVPAIILGIVSAFVLRKWAHSLFDLLFGKKEIDPEAFE